MTKVEILHEKALDIAEEAFLLKKKGRDTEAIIFFCKALELETKAASFFPLNPNSEPTRSILYSSAASLAFHAKKFKEAQRLVYQGLAGYPPVPIENELKELNEQINFEFQNYSVK